MSDGKYVRVYYKINDDPKFDGIRSDSALLGTWLRLLMVADAVWPASADLPRWVRKSQLDTLTGAAIVDVLPGDRFRVRGLDNERESRRDSARVGGLASGRSRGSEQPLNDRSAIVDQTTNLAKPSRPEQSKAEQPRASDPADAYYRMLNRFPSESVLTWLDDLSEKYGSEAVVKSLGSAYSKDRTVKTLLGRVQDELRAGARELDRAERVAERQKVRQQRRATFDDPLLANIRGSLKESGRYEDGAA